LTANEIWTLATKKDYDKQLNNEDKTCWRLGAKIYLNAKDNPKLPFAKIDSRKKKFYSKSQVSQLDFFDAVIPKEPNVFKKNGLLFKERLVPT